jgi:hypothetical protein
MLPFAQLLLPHERIEGVHLSSPLLLLLRFSAPLLFLNLPSNRPLLLLKNEHPQNFGMAGASSVSEWRWGVCGQTSCLYLDSSTRFHSRSRKRALLFSSSTLSAGASASIWLERSSSDCLFRSSRIRKMAFCDSSVELKALSFLRYADGS